MPKDFDAIIETLVQVRVAERAVKGIYDAAQRGDRDANHRMTQSLVDELTALLFKGDGNKGRTSWVLHLVTASLMSTLAMVMKDKGDVDRETTIMVLSRIATDMLRDDEPADDTSEQD